MTSDFDDSPQWYWAAWTGDVGEVTPAGDKFVIASGQRELWRRVRTEIDVERKCHWHSFGPKDGKATLADCARIFLTSREMYGVNYNRLTIELAQVAAWAKLIKEAPSDLCNWVSNPISLESLPREKYDVDREEALGQRIAATLGLEGDWWR
jgi:hypothetical protein